MKSRFDKRSVKRSFQPGDQVLVLLPILSSALHARFSCPYCVEKKLSETNYVIGTPDRKRKSRICHINMLKSYVSEKPQDSAANKVEAARPVEVKHVVLCSIVDGLNENEVIPEYFQNSTVLSTVYLYTDNYFAYLP